MVNEAEMYHAAATVSTLLLKLGEVSRRFHNAADAANATSSLDRAFSVLEVKHDNEEKQKLRSSTASKIDDAKNWSITFEQLIASLLTDNLLVQYFDEKYDLNTILAEYKSQHA